MYGVLPSFAFGRQEPLTHLHALTMIYKALADNKIADVRKRAEAGLFAMERTGMTLNVLQNLASGVTGPLREALRTAQLSPSGDWSLQMYSLIGRNDLAEGFSSQPAVFVNNGYRAPRDILVRTCVVNYLGRPHSECPTAPNDSSKNLSTVDRRRPPDGVKGSSEDHWSGARYRGLHAHAFRI